MEQRPDKKPLPDRGALRESIRNVVVIDDKEEVAYYVWRELGETAGFGSAEAQVESYGKARPWSVPLVVPSGDLNVWWVPAMSEWRAHLKDLFERDEFRRGGSFFLVDVRGPVGESLSHGKQSGYAFREVLEAIREKVGELSKHVWLISSYEHGARKGLNDKEVFEIRSKSPKVLRELRRDLLVAEAGEGKIDSAHVLVTGAGFELQGQPENQIIGRIGIPSTSTLLGRWIEQVYRGEEVVREGVKFPFPERLRSSAELKKAAKTGDLDKYWSSLLRAEREVAKYDISTIVRREFELRERFRDEFVQYDWGFLPQAVAAARLEWSAWVSTNYTRFANRAADLFKGKWRAIEFGEEAQYLSREILHGKGRYSGESLLFKVHGDIGHVLTMALSMEDKTEETRLSSFLPLYLAAQAYLQGLTRERSRITWHIVGHGLKDKLLLQIIKSAYQIKDSQHRFVVIAPASPQDLRKKRHPMFELQESLGSGSDIQAYSAKADEYLTRLARLGGLVAHDKVLQGLKGKRLNF